MVFAALACCENIPVPIAVTVAPIAAMATRRTIAIVLVLDACYRTDKLAGGILRQ